MKAEHDTGQREQARGEIVGDLLGHGAVGPAQKAAIEVALVDRRGPGSGLEGGVVHGRHDDDPARTSSARSVRARSKSATGPSYSSPWLAPVSSAVGPSPCLITAMGIITEPQAESSRL